MAAIAALWAAVVCGCAQRRPARPSAPPPSAPVAEVRRAIGITHERAKSAEGRVQTIIKEIETIREVTDPATSEKLAQVQAELFRVTAELRDAQEAATRAEEQAILVEHRSEALRVWGIEQQAIAHANADGWEKAEGARRDAEGERDKARAVANKRGNLVGMLGAGTLAALGLKLFTFAVPWTALFPVAGGVAGYFGARFIL